MTTMNSPETKFKQWQEVKINSDITNCPGQSLFARIISINQEGEEAFVQVDNRCTGCDCGPEARFVKLKYLEVANV